MLSTNGATGAPITSATSSIRPMSRMASIPNTDPAVATAVVPDDIPAAARVVLLLDAAAAAPALRTETALAAVVLKLADEAAYEAV